MGHVDEPVGAPATPGARKVRVTQPERRPSRAQFALKSLLGLVLLVCLLSGWLSFRIRHCECQRQAITAIGQLGGEVIYSGWGTPEWLRSLLGQDVFLEVSVVCFTPDSPIDDDGLAWLTRFPEVHHLDLTGTRITDAGLAHIRELTELQVLRLSGTHVSDVGLVQLSESQRHSTSSKPRPAHSDARVGRLLNLGRRSKTQQPHTS